MTQAVVKRGYPNCEPVGQRWRTGEGNPREGNQHARLDEESEGVTPLLTYSPESETELWKKVLQTIKQWMEEIKASAIEEPIIENKDEELGDMYNE